MKLNAKKRCLRRHQTDIRAGSATGALTSIKRKNQPNTSSTQTRYENDDQTRPSEAAQIKFSPCFLANCCKGGHYVCMWCFMQKTIVGKDFGRAGQCPKSLPKPIFVRETTCREPGITTRKPKMNLKLCDVKEPNGPQRRRLKAPARKPKETPKRAQMSASEVLGSTLEPAR